MLWPIGAIIVSLAGLVGLLLLGNWLDGDPVTRQYSWNQLFIPYYIALTFYAFYIVVVLAWVFTGCCSRRRRRRTINVDDDNNDDEDDAQLADYGKREPADPGTFGERLVHLVDAGIYLLFITLLFVVLLVLAHTLEQPVPMWGAFFVLLVIVELLYGFFLLVGTLQTCILESAPAERVTPGVALLGGVVCCYSGDADRHALAVEAEEDYDRNANSDIARAERYERRAVFQDRPCVYCCVPWSLPLVEWILAALLWLVPIAIFISTILLYWRLASIPPPDLVPVELTRVFAGRYHHIATAMPFVVQQIAHDGIITLTEVFIPLYIVLGLLILQSLCLVMGCCVQGRTAAEFILGLVYELWLILVLVFLILLANRVDGAPPPEGEPADSWHTTFTPLYILFVVTIIVVTPIIACIPKSYAPERGYVSEWGVVVYKKE